MVGPASPNAGRSSGRADTRPLDFLFAAVVYDLLFPPSSQNDSPNFGISRLELSFTD